MVPRPNWQPFGDGSAAGFLARPSVCCIPYDVLDKPKVVTQRIGVPKSREQRLLSDLLGCAKEVHKLPMPRPRSHLPRSASAPGLTSSMPERTPSASKLKIEANGPTSSSRRNSISQRYEAQGSQSPTLPGTKNQGQANPRSRDSRPSSAPISRYKLLRSDSAVTLSTEKERRSSVSLSSQPVLEPAQRRRSSITTLLKNQFYRRQEVRQKEKLAEIALKTFNKSVKRMLDRLSGGAAKRHKSQMSSRSRGASSSSSTSCSSSDLESVSDDGEQKARDEEELISALRRSDLDAGLRLKAILCLARILAEREDESGSKKKVEIAELGENLLKEKAGILKEPWVALELAELCEQSLSLTKAADMIYEELEQVVLSSEDVQHTYMLIDLAKRHHRNGRDDAARALFEHARAVPPPLRDHRCRPRFYEWRFDEEVVIPDDSRRVSLKCSSAEDSLKFVRPVGGLQADCICARGAVSQAPTLKLKEWRRNVIGWNRSKWEEACEAHVAKAEKFVSLVAVAAACLDDDAKLMEMPLGDTRTARENTIHAVEAAQAELLAARTFVTSKQIEATVKDSPEIVDHLTTRFHMRLSSAEGEVTKHKQLADAIGKQLMVEVCAQTAEKTVKDALQKVACMEKRVKEAHDLVSDLQVDSSSDWETLAEMVKTATAACCIACGQIKELEHFLSLEASSLGVCELQVKKFSLRTRDAHVQMNELNLSLREISEKTNVGIMLADCDARVERALEACSRAQTAVLGGDASAEDALIALQSAELAAQEAQAFVTMKSLSAKRLVVQSNLAVEGLDQVQLRLDGAMHELRAVRERIDHRGSEGRL